MTLTKRSSAAKKRRKKIIKLAKGFKGSNSKLFKPTNQTIMHSFKYSYSDRRKKKRIFKNIWIRRINGEARKHSISYNKFIFDLKNKSIYINKKILSEIIVNDNITFKKIISSSK